MRRTGCKLLNYSYIRAFDTEIIWFDINTPQNSRYIIISSNLYLILSNGKTSVA